MPKPKCDDELVRRAVKLKKGGATNVDIAKALGISESTFYRWVSTPSTDAERELSESLKKAEADYKNALQGIIAKAAQERDWKAAAWLLERKYPEEYGRRMLDLRGDIGVKTISAEARAEMEELLGIGRQTPQDAR